MGRRELHRDRDLTGSSLRRSLNGRLGRPIFVSYAFIIGTGPRVAHLASAGWSGPPEDYKHAAVHPKELQCRARLPLPPMLGSIFSLLQLTGHTVQFV